MLATAGVRPKRAPLATRHARHVLYVMTVVNACSAFLAAVVSDESFERVSCQGIYNRIHRSPPIPVRVAIRNE